MQQARKQRWYWYSNERARLGTGPFGPFEAQTARYDGLTLNSVVAAYHIEGEGPPE